MTKELADGTVVDDSVPTRQTSAGRILLTAAEIQEIADEEQADRDRPKAPAILDAEDALALLVDKGVLDQAAVDAIRAAKS